MKGTILLAPIKPRIVVFSESQSSNLGDKAIAASMLEILSRSYDVGTEHFGNLPRSDTGSAFSARSKLKYLSRALWLKFKGYVPRFIKSWLASKRKKMNGEAIIRYREAIAHADIVIVGGGQLIKNNRECFCDRIKVIGDLAQSAGVPTLLFGVGVDRNMNVRNWKAVESFLRTSLIVATRDEISRKRIIENVSSEMSIDVIPDVAFGLSVANLGPANGQRANIIGINIMSFAAMLAHSTRIDRTVLLQNIGAAYKNIVDSILAAGIRPILFTTGSDSDFIQAKVFRDQYLQRTGHTLDVFHPSRLDDLCLWLASTSHVFAARMHSGILAYTALSNPVCINWDDKVEGVWKAIGQGNRVKQLHDLFKPEFAQDFLKLLKDTPPPDEAHLRELKQIIHERMTASIASKFALAELH